jgi:uncharacterized membrane protein
MDPLFWFNVLVRWVHVTSAVVAVGGLVVARLIFWPAMQAAGEGASGSREAADRRLGLLIHTAIGLLLLSGAYNLYLVLPRANAATMGGLARLYHSVLGVKILLALVVFGFVGALVSPSPRPERRAARARWVSIAIALALAVLLCSATLRRLWDLVPR